MVKEEGTLYGTNCSTDGKFETIGGAGNCEAITIKQISSELISNSTVSTYQLGIENSMKGGRKAAIMILTFSRGVNTTNLNVESGLEVIWNGSLIEFDTKISYACKNGMKIEDDFKILQVEATCRSGNTWEEPLWLNCVDSKFHHCIGKYHGSQTVMLFSHYSQIMSCPATSPRGWFCHGEGRGHALRHQLLN